MMSKRIEPAPFGGDLELAVARLADVLAPVDLGACNVDDASNERREAGRAFAAAQETHSAVCRQYAGAIAEAARTGFAPPQPVKDAQRALEQAESRQKEARKAHNRARENQDTAFLRDVMPQINEAAPILLEVIRLLNDAVNPLAALYGYSASRNLPQPRLLMSAPTMREATRALTAAINFATEPPPKTTNDDED